MQTGPHLLGFSTFILDLRNETLFGDGRPITLRPKTFHVLRCLVEQSGSLVRTADLLRTVWPETAVSSTVLRVCICELRDALTDDADDPHFVQTIHGRGYRFIAPVCTSTN